MYEGSRSPIGLLPSTGMMRNARNASYRIAIFFGV